MAVLLDSGFLFASLNASESEHQATIRVLENIREPIVLPVPAITEIAYLLARDINNEAAADFVASLAATELLSRFLVKKITRVPHRLSGSIPMPSSIS
jgi:predicted nucleic acid-binding protein